MATARMGTGRGFDREIRVMLGSALVLFVWTVGIGILNGTDVMDFERKALLSHLHMGTLGWISIAVFAATYALFDGESTRMTRVAAWLAPVTAVLYNLAFLTTTSVVRPIVGTLMMLVIIAFAVHALTRLRGRTLSVPHLAMLAGLTTVVIGAVLGVLLGLRLAGTMPGLPMSLAEAHPATMVVGFLVPAGMGYAEMVLRPSSVSDRASWVGWVQIALPFVGGLMALAGFLRGTFELVQAGLPLEIIGTIIFLVRMMPTALRTSLVADGAERFAVPVLVFLPMNIAILVSIIVRFAPDLSTTPVRQFEALDHSIFVGVLTFSIMGFVVQRSAARVSPLVSQFIFWGMLLGVSGFVTGLLIDSTPLIRVATPLLGTAILTSVVVRAPGLLRGQ